MSIALEVTFHGLDCSDALKKSINDRVAKLQRFYNHIDQCRVTVEKEHENARDDHTGGTAFQIILNLSVPGDTLIVKRLSENNQSLDITLHDAFEVMERRVKDYSQRHRSS